MTEIETLKTDIDLIETNKKRIVEKVLYNYFHMWSRVPKHEQAKRVVSILTKE